MAGVAIFVLALLATACETDTQKIKDANEAAGSSAPSSDTGGPEKISIFDLRTGDCYNEPSLGAIGDDEEVELEEVERVPCSSNYQFKIAASMLADDPADGKYPGVPFFDDMAFVGCPDSTTFVFFPTTESWEVGDRVVSCIEER